MAGRHRAACGGGVIRMKETNVTYPMDRPEAQAITDRIRKAVDGLWSLLLEAHERKAWKALGYATWEAYIKAEFDMSRQNSYRLLDQARVVREIEEVVPHAGQITQRDAEAIKADLPAVTTVIKQRVEAGEKPETAVRETIDAAREAKAKAKAMREAQQAENDRQREEHAANLPAFVAEREQAKADAIAARKRPPTQADFDALHAENEELREANAALEADVARLSAENKLYDEMKVQFAQGGFDKVVAGKEEEIRVLQSRLYGESADKASWMKSAKFWQTEAKKLGFSRDAEIDLETGEIVNG